MLIIHVHTCACIQYKLLTEVNKRVYSCIRRMREGGVTKALLYSYLNSMYLLLFCTFCLDVQIGPIIPTFPLQSWDPLWGDGPKGN